MEQKSTKYKWLVASLKYGLIAIPIAAYIWFVFRYSVNMPRQDDYDSILNYLIEYKKASFYEKIGLLFSQHNEHRLLLSRIACNVYYYLFGCVNFRHLIIFNIVPILSIFLFLSAFIKKSIPNHWFLGVFALSICLFDLNNYENADFAMAGIQNYGVIAVFLASMYFYSLSNNKVLPLAILFQAVCIYTSGNGGIGAIIILLYCILAKDRLRIISSLLVCLIFIPLYYYKYSAQEHFFTLDIPKVFSFFMHVISTHFSFKYAMVFGVLIVLGFITFLPIKRGFKFMMESNPILCVLLFLFGSTVAMSLVRSSLPIECANASRYFIYSHLIVGMVFVLFLAKYPSRRFTSHIATLFMLVLGYVYVKNYEDGKNGFQAFYHMSVNYEYNYPDSVRAKTITDESCRQKIYCIEEERLKINKH